MEGAKLVKAYLEEANLAGAYLFMANLEGANLQGANLEMVDFEEANLLGTHQLTIDQLSRVKTLHNAKLDKELCPLLQVKYPALFEISNR